MESVVIYARVSSTEQVSGYSIEAQVDVCRAWANERGYTVTAVYIEPGRSARTDKRPAFQRMIRNISAGTVDAVVIHKMDRFARNRRDFLQLVFLKHGLHVNQAGRVSAVHVRPGFEVLIEE